MVFCIMSLKITLVNLLPHLPGANELKHDNEWMVCLISVICCETLPHGVMHPGLVNIGSGNDLSHVKYRDISKQVQNY